MDKTAIIRLQNSLNKFVDRYPHLGNGKLRVDGEKGQLTEKLFRDVQFLIGYKHENLRSTPDNDFYHRIGQPNRVEQSWGQTKEAVRRGQKRRASRRISVRRYHIVAFLHPGVGRFDGVPVAKTAIPVLRWCREHGANGEKWQGRLVSGWRDPKYSRSLCINMCGQPSCPGRCAGLSSNHVGSSPERFAMDVSDYGRFGRVVAHCPIKPHVHNSLGAQDPVHFSPSGN